MRFSTMSLATGKKMFEPAVTSVFATVNLPLFAIPKKKQCYWVGCYPLLGKDAYTGYTHKILLFRRDKLYG